MHPSPHSRRIITILLTAFGLLGMAVFQGQSSAEPQGKGQGKGGKGQGKGKGKGQGKDANVAPSPDAVLPTEWTQLMNWRCIGPANMGGRVTALSVFEADPTTY